MESIDKILQQIHQLEADLSAELMRQKNEVVHDVERGSDALKKEIEEGHRRLKKGLLKYIWTADFKSLLAAFFLYPLIVPFILLDISVSLYQRVCFPLFGIARIKRHDFLIFDRQQLAYLNLIEKLNCMYCSYANGLIAYVREIAGKTEQYWCPIKHAKRVYFGHAYYKNFTERDDAHSYHINLEQLRQNLKEKNFTKK